MSCWAKTMDGSNGRSVVIAPASLMLGRGLMHNRSRLAPRPVPRCMWQLSGEPVRGVGHSTAAALRVEHKPCRLGVSPAQVAAVAESCQYEKKHQTWMALVTNDQSPASYQCMSQMRRLAGRVSRETGRGCCDWREGAWQGAHHSAGQELIWLA
jgi:hypothetical protein